MSYYKFKAQLSKLMNYGTLTEEEIDEHCHDWYILFVERNWVMTRPDTVKQWVRFHFIEGGVTLDTHPFEAKK